ncbi:hypothetical protein ACOMHN_032979 [Nucella lapillus]
MSAENKPSVDDEDSVSMLEVLAQESRMQEDASAVLGGSDDQECTYPKGYVKRQALYACSTCATSEPAALCLACSYHCHEGHDLYELYTKRQFRCDCGNSKFTDSSCKLVPTKDDVNAENKYNQNFRGAYCTCSRPYPDPDDEMEDDMIQCVMCEDWYHGRHLGAEVPENESYQEMICATCMAKHPFLWAYQVHSPAVTVQKGSEGDEKVDIEGEERRESKPDSSPTSPPPPAVKKEHQGPSPTEALEQNAGKETELEGSSPVTDQKRKREAESSSSTEGEAANSSTSESPAKKAKTGGGESGSREAEGRCLLRDLQKRTVAVKDRAAAFWQDGWREKLCGCRACVSMMQGQGLSFLLDVTDTVGAYEEQGRSSAQPISDLEQEQHILSGMGRVQQIEMINGFNNLKSELSDFFKTFAETGKVVSADDIKGFFSRMEDKRKKERATSMQYFCK